MTNQEAIRILESIMSEMLLSFDHDRKEALKLAIEALEKQMPQKIKMPMDANYICPICGRRLSGVEDYCPWCGQRIER